MRDFNLILAAILGIALMTACGAQKQIATEAQERMPTGEVDPSILCSDDSDLDDDEYFRALGIGIAVSIDEARKEALRVAQQELISKKATSSLNTHNIINAILPIKNNTIEGHIEASYIIDGALIEKTCEKMIQRKDELYQSCIAIQYPKSDIKQESTKIDYNAEEFYKQLDKAFDKSEK